MPNEILQTLDKSWSFTEKGGGQGTKDGEWLEVSKFPTNVHSELLQLKRIPDPFVGFDEYKVQWIGESEWVFKTEFEVTQEALDRPHVDIIFEGLDTYATVELNGTSLLEASNMFVSNRVPAKQHLKLGKNNLVITFPSTFFKGVELEEKHGKKVAWNGSTTRLHVRKAQYHYGWDWGPTIMTVGPWKPIRLHAYTTRISDLNIKTIVSDSLDTKFNIALTASGTLPSSEPLQAKLAIKKPDGSLLATENITLNDQGTGSLSLEYKKGELELWFPVGYGAQPLYTFEVSLEDGEGKQVAESKSQRVGVRRARVVQEPLEGQEGLSFLFEVNNIRIWIGGSNWIPADSFLTEISDVRYREWLQLVVDGNQNMIRVWGGGIFEPDVFYDTCDELGILVWQDFMFACGQYPAYDEFVELVKPEVEQAIVRLRHHPSLVIWAGNNEDYMLAEILRLPVDWSDLSSDPRTSALPARYIYETVLPELVEKLSGNVEDGGVFYHRSSPYSIPGKSSMDLKYGDLHNWNVWHGAEEGWQKWDVMSARFTSEFGMQAFPDRRTVDAWVGDHQSERHPQSRLTASHNKSTGHEKRLAKYLVENFRHSYDMDGHIYTTQLMQSEAVASAYRVWRRNWKGQGKEYAAGALVWQMNDCWPVTSWALVDYYLRPKPAYFTVAREMRPVTVGVARKEKKGPPAHNPKSVIGYKIESSASAWASNTTVEPIDVDFVLEAFDIRDPTFQWKESKSVSLAPNTSTELWEGPLPGQVALNHAGESSRTIVFAAKIVDKQGLVLSRNASWPEPFKYINFPPPSELGLTLSTSTPTASDLASIVKTTYVSSSKQLNLEGASLIRLSSKLPIKGIVLDVEGEADARWTDQALDLVPGDDQTVLAWGLNGRKVTARYLGDGLSA